MYIQRDITPRLAQTFSSALARANAVRVRFYLILQMLHIKEIVVVSLGGQKIQLSPECLVVPIGELHDFLTLNHAA